MPTPTTRVLLRLPSSPSTSTIQFPIPRPLLVAASRMTVSRLRVRELDSNLTTVFRCLRLDMLSRANKDYEAKRPTEPSLPKPSTARPTLANRLFPSSSPNPSVVEQLIKSTHPAAPSRPAALSSRALNLPAKTNHSTSQRSFASLHNANSFKEEPAVISHLDNDLPSQRQNLGIGTSVYIAEDDLSDDDNLELDFEAPLALPPMPRPCPAPIETKSPPPPASSVLSWSQSSPSHYVAAKDRLLSQAPAKRKSDVIDLSGLDDPSPVPKKRSLPKSWAETKREEEQSTSAQAGYSTPFSKQRSTSSLPWDTTASAVKEQKKQLRGQQKRAFGTVTEFSKDDIQDAIHATKATSKNSAISLSNEQRHVKSLVCDSNKSVFFTGPAGTGKSVLMRAIITELKKKFRKDPERLAVTASTGLAACNIGGMTLHSFAGIGLGKEDVPTLVKKIRRNAKAKNRWLRTKVLIIDEISMVDGDLFDKLSQIGRTIRSHGKPWGGIQLVITGDFFQLPPVPDGADKRDIKFAFEAATWNTSIDHTIGLNEVFRQKDPEFANMLNEMRLGRISDQTVKNFKSLARPLNFNHGLEVTELFPTRHEVEQSNERRLRSLTSKPYRYDAIDSGDPQHRERHLQNMMAPKTLELRKGAQVMLIKNMDDTLVNGSLGTVIRFMSETSFEASGGYDYGSGAEDDENDKVDSDKRKRIIAFSRQLEASTSGQDHREYPVVRFHAADGSPRVLLCVPEEWKSELPTGEVQASRKQVPLILAWALSIHKAQGQTLERVKVDLGKVFEKGQAYVALSRAVRQEGLQVLRFDKHKVMAHPRVVQFYNKLYSAETAMGVANGGGRGVMPSAFMTGSG